MKKNNGFVFVETIVVISLVCVVLISLFTLFYSVYNEEHKRMNYDNPQNLYAAYFIKKFLEENNINSCFINFTEDDLFKEITYNNSSNEYCNINNSKLLTLKSNFDVKNIYLLSGDINTLKISSVKNQLSANVIDYIKTLNSTDANAYYLLLEFKSSSDFTKVASVKLSTDISNTNVISTLTNKNDSNLKTTSDGLIYYTGNPNNYFKFAGYMFRIVRANEDGSIRIIFSDTYNMHSYLDKDLYVKKDEIETKLSNFYYNYLAMYSDYISMQQYCNNDIKNVSSNNFSFTCDNIVSNYGQITYDEIVASKDNNGNSFLINNDNNSFWSSSYSNSKNNFVSFSFKDLKLNSTNTITTKNYILPVISIKGNLNLLGDGTKNNPYTIMTNNNNLYTKIYSDYNKSEFTKATSSSNEECTLYYNNNRFFYRGYCTNNYVDFAGEKWRILGINANKSIKLVLATPKYHKSNYNDNFNYLIDDFENKLSKYKSYLTNENFCYETRAKYNNTGNVGTYYTNYNNYYNCNQPVESLTGLLTYDDALLAGLYPGKTGNSFLNISNASYTYYLGSKADMQGNVQNIWYVDRNSLKIQNKNNTLNYIRPVINLKGNVILSKGDGSEKNPYKIKGVD